ncbi:MAG: GlsB/YeaQ/YmgE family stress response membrane protein [Planctomycetales bacterium]|nr:GlsB/YeaQ/YmgE family stress response membrane protein [Planctomycetales bacterium]NIM10304.1 GlsB/YeaQ/YmgE family stress response membrane protein [Planctomycetales bacterium]NIN09743.1 GlsB/YeaQ/YmgE family stress response membrane protein [Planctomycetales bacterium]NIN78868.1 GlsB/YeaQ/YmgE family stress response membrane protein [Planctomycetales bacterium]NIO36035.1 GlsB/YeaQ/YmgE family stress response membrane protein [Planctomycetales bacterium]
MSYMYWAMIGLLAGALAKLIMPGKDPGGIIITMLIGLAGAYVGGLLGKLAGIEASSTIGNLGIATAGALVLLFMFRVIKGRKISGE